MPEMQSKESEVRPRRATELEMANGMHLVGRAGVSCHLVPLTGLLGGEGCELPEFHLQDSPRGSPKPLMWTVDYWHLASKLWVHFLASVFCVY